MRLPRCSTSALTTPYFTWFESLCGVDKLFVEIPQPSAISWNSMISGHVRTGKFRKALGLFLQLHRSDRAWARNGNLEQASLPSEMPVGDTLNVFAKQFYK
ncbi:hypothetical protein V6N12_021862 [Hibiscus sabdariffa]|uniref:Uncharacterized protein n=1 Tax=Hibiscus sabdariffa TaxID=183260 RepID=A0ABR2FT11_9ROSI